MMADLDILRDLIKANALAMIENHYGKKVLILKEARAQPEYSIQVRNVPNDIIAIDMDKFPRTDGILRNSKGECKRADFIILAHTAKAKWLIYLEMKSGHGRSNTEIVQQLMGAKCFVAYCRAVGRLFWNQPKFLEANSYRQRFISIKNISVNKKPTRLPKSVTHDSPDKMLKISAPGNNRVQFNLLVGRP